jgi:hypothetical protein
VSGCRTAEKSLLLIKDRQRRQDKLVWKFIRDSRRRSPN